MKIPRILFMLVSGAAFFACIGTQMEEHPCPPGGTTLTYQNFGADFFNTHCTECHGGARSRSDRSYETLERIRDEREGIFINAASDNKTMPPGPNGPSDAERAKLADWLACGAP